jgi:membrane associated rhomboid family serine protease|tara:strand:- start:1139 stop:1765 length:627 start_codon:yes stop_codon:yes gene_type:complete
MGQELTPIITYVILGITVLTSYKAFEDYELKSKFLFTPYLVKHQGEWYRLFSHGIIHADWTHLLVNMFVLYSFGTLIESTFIKEYGLSRGRINYLLLYLGGIVVSTVNSYIKHQDDISYNALGASGATSAVLYSFVVMYPTEEVYLYFIPITAWIFGVIYLMYSHYMAKKGNDNIGHDAHIGGAIYGVVLTVLFNPDYFFTFFEKVFS